LKKFYDIKISHASNGIIVEAGCIKLVYQQDQLEMFDDHLELYLTDPEKGYKLIRERWHIDQGDEEQPVAETAREEVPDKTSNVKEAKKAEE